MDQDPAKVSDRIPNMVIIDGVAVPGCLSRILIYIHPGSDNNTKTGGGENIYLSYHFL
jgi:hypothetical protein